MKRRLLIIILVFIIISTSAVLRMSRYYSIACEEYAGNGVKGRISSEINKNISSILNNSDFKTEDIVKFSYDESGKLKSAHIESDKLNYLAMDIAESVYRSIDSADTDFGFPIGNTTGIKYLSGKGRNINVRIIPTGAVSYELKSELLSGGINQTLYRIKILFNSNISVIAPFFKKDETIETNVVVAEILIIGDVPNMLLPFSE